VARDLEVDASSDGDGDPVPDVFPPGDPAARFVVVMSMARNDIDRALRDTLRSGEQDGPDFSYRVRLVTGHLVEAIDALSRYRSEYPAVRDLIERVPATAKEHLKVVARTLQRAGPRVLAGVRDNTFHYPSPNPSYTPTSDEKLRRVLAAMADRGVSFHFDGDTLATTMSFADEAALDLAMGRPESTVEDVRREALIARDGALAFHKWVDGLLRAYIEANDLVIGDPVVTPKNPPDTGS
jgi:hypothetical protein